MSQTLARRDFLKGAALAAASARALVAAPEQYVTAETAFGKIRGLDSGGVKTFKGIRYGATTAGRNRFMPPLDPAKWGGVRDALDYGPTAPQTDPAAAARTKQGPAESENCLVLNVWTPAVGDNRKRPVMLWCHGGGFATGSGS